jgi:DNA-binding NarL/FixJ family response regulator
MPDAPIRLILADDHPIVLNGLQQLFERHRDFRVVACCVTGEAALEAVRHEPADVLVLDLRMPGLNGIDVLRVLGTEQRPCRVVVLTAALRDADVAELVRCGAKGLVLKESSPETLLDCVRRVHAGEQWIDRNTLIRAFGRAVRSERAAREASALLTPRELEIVRMVSQGLRNREIATRLSISEGTVKIHLHNVYEKVGVDGRLELVLYAQDHGFL